MSAQPDLMPKVRALPHKPGVYLFKDRFHKVIYVGKARDLHRRVAQYFHPSRRMSADLKTRALVESIWDLETHEVHSEPESILLEGRLIKEYRPRYNISFRDDKRFLLVKTNLNDPFPRFQLTRVRKEDGCRYFGPFAHSGALRSTLNLLKKIHGLRSCQPVIPGEKDHRHCLDHIIKNCCAPCIGKTTRSEYLARVQQACAFLEGRSAEMMAELEEEMRRAAERLDFEKAALLRNMLKDIRQTTTPRRQFVREIPTTVIPERDLSLLRDALGLQAPPALIECFDISNISVTHKVASMVVFRNGRPDRAGYRRFRIRGVDGQDDFASMAEVVGRRYRRLAAEGRDMPDLVVVDGGKGQVSSALRELEALGLGTQPIIGLAKQREEIFRPFHPEPIVLPPESGALRLLQRIRDEAHRFANGYHQLLMKKRMSESVLDECPGVSEAKKRALLTRFGSVQRMKTADKAHFLEVPGVGEKLAGELVAFFQRLKRTPSQTLPASEAGPGDVVYSLRSKHPSAGPD
ncbi:MAG: excinuclease ABC subunit UvrC [Candidatus Methylacidiphilales bacterium]|nr:excinuclease ABC subunit UvrC [Candidatus Methylacidiphilales bacterium]